MRLEEVELNTATVSIGDCEGGWIRADSVITCQPERQSINSALKGALSDESREKVKTVVNPHDKPDTAARVPETLKNLNTTDTLKKIFDNNVAGASRGGVQ